jgi:hypothetical protein
MALLFSNLDGLTLRIAFKPEGNRVRLPRAKSESMLQPVFNCHPIQSNFPEQSATSMQNRTMRILASVAVITVSAPLLVAQATAPKAPSVDAVLEHYAQALGGRSEFGQARSMILKGNIEIPSLKTTGTVVEYFEAPARFASITAIPGYGTLRTVCDGIAAWNEDAKGVIHELSGGELADVRRRADIQWHLKLKQFYPGLKVMGRETIDRRETWVLESTTDGWIFRLYFDAASGELVRFDTDTGKPGGFSSIAISDYRPVGRLRFAFGASMAGSQSSWTRRLSEVKFNVPIDDAVFAKAPTAN